MGFFSCGVMWALLKDEGKDPEDREFTREVRHGRKSGLIAWRRDEVIWLRTWLVGEQEFGNDSLRKGAVGGEQRNGGWGAEKREEGTGRVEGTEHPFFS